MRALLLTFFFISSVVLVAQNQMTVNLYFNIKNIPADEEVQLAYRYGDKTYIKKELGQFQNGAYSYQSDSVDRGVYLLNFKDKNSYFEFILNEPTFSLTADYNDLNNTQASLGSKENEVFFDFIKKVNEHNQKVLQVDEHTAWDDQRKEQEMQSLNEEMTQYRESILSENQGLLVTDLLKGSIDPIIPDVPEGMSEADAQNFRFNYYREHFFDNLNFENSALLYSPIIYSKIQTYRDQLTYQEPDSLLKAANHMIELASVDSEVKKYMIIEFLNFFAKSKVVCMDKAYVGMVDRYYASGEASWVDSDQLNKIIENANNLRNNLCGERAFNFTLKDSEGKSVSLHSIQAEWTVILFLDSDCSSCERELQNLKSLDLSEVDYKIVTVHLKEDETWQKQVSDLKGDQYIHLKDVAGLVDWEQQYNLRAFPMVYVLDKDKVIQLKRVSVGLLPQIMGKQ